MAELGTSSLKFLSRFKRKRPEVWCVNELLEKTSSSRVDGSGGSADTTQLRDLQTRQDQAGQRLGLYQRGKTQRCLVRIHFGHAHSRTCGS